MKKALLIMFAVMAVLPLLASAQGTFDGIVFGDYYYVNSHHLEELEGKNGFIIRRIYFTYKYKISDEWLSVFRLEMNHPGDFVSNDTLKPYVKDAYLRYRMDENSFFIGILGTPAGEAYDSIWGYRSIEAYPMHVQKLIGSRDLGIGYEYKSDPLTFKATFGNGENNKNEINNGKSYNLHLSYGKDSGLYAEGFYNFTDKNNGIKESMFQAFLAYRDKWGKIGALYARKNIETDGSDADYNMVSFFGVFPIGEQLELFLRYDKMMDANPAAENASYLKMSGLNPSNYLIGGLSYKINKNISFIPNVQYVFYDEEDGIDTDSDLILRATFCYKF